MGSRLNDTGKAVLTRINDEDYPLAFSADGRRVFNIGTVFNRGKRDFSHWGAGDEGGGEKRFPAAHE